MSSLTEFLQDLLQEGRVVLRERPAPGLWGGAVPALHVQIVTRPAAHGIATFGCVVTAVSDAAGALDSPSGEGPVAGGTRGFFTSPNQVTT